MNIIIIIIIIIIWCPISVVVALAKCEVQQALGPGIITGPEPAKTFEDGLQMKDKSNGQLSLFFFSARGRRGRRRRRSSRRNRRSRKKRTLVAPPPHTHTLLSFFAPFRLQPLVSEKKPILAKFAGVVVLSTSGGRRLYPPPRLGRWGSIHYPLHKHY